MKKLVVLAVLAAFILGTAGFASAIELKASGQWRVHFNYLKDAGAFNNNSKEDDFQALHRARIAFEFIANENLKGVIQLQAGNIKWGLGGGEINNANSNITARQLYLNFKVPGTDAAIMAGKLPFSLPSTYGSHILAGNHAALATSIPFNDMVGLTAGWARAYDRTQGTFDTKIEDEVDVFFAVLPIKMDGVRLNPFGVYARWGKDFLGGAFSELADLGGAKNANQWFAGLNFTVDMLDPIVFKGDLNYGTVKLTDDFKASGFMVNLAAQYKMDMFTPEIFWLYETGEDSGYPLTSDSKRMPTIHTDGTSWAPTAMGFVGSSFGGADGLLRSALNSLPGANSYDKYLQTQGTIGMWALGLKLGGIQFVDRLSHDLIFLYAQGTNDKANTGLFTEDDKYYEVSFDNSYQIYENLSAVLELGWAKLDLDKLNTSDRDDWLQSNAWKAVFGFHYRF